MDPEKPKKIEYGSCTEVDYYWIWIEEVLKAFGKVSGSEPLLITDLSIIGEILEDDEVEAIAKELGIPVKPHDLFIDVAKRLKKSRE